MAELVTSMLIGPLVSMVKDKVSNYLLEEYKVMDGMEEQREILKRKLPAILDIIEDAEKGAYKVGVAWLKALKKVSYEANDIFDELKYEALRREAKKKREPQYARRGCWPKLKDPQSWKHAIPGCRPKQALKVKVGGMQTDGFRVSKNKAVPMCFLNTIKSLVSWLGPCLDASKGAEPTVIQARPTRLRLNSLHSQLKTPLRSGRDSQPVKADSKPKTQESFTSMLIGPLVSIVKNKVSSYLLDEYKVMEGMEEQREVLERKLPAILHIIDDAEEKGAHEAGALKKVSYEANDVFDEFKYEALRREAKKRGHQPHHNMLGMDVASLFPAYNPIMFRRRMGKKLRKIVQDIEVLVTEMNSFGFRDRRQAPSPMPLRQMDPVMIDSEKDIVSRSRNEEKKKIVKILIDNANNADLLVLPIIGLGGLGKTTFVQLVYSDPEIENHFQFQKWYCVSEDFDVGNIARGICNSAEKDSEIALKDLQKQLRGRRCLLVLDDVWNQDVNKWENLQTCLQHAGTGSALLTTTRDAKVAQIMPGGKAEAHSLGNLDDVFLKEILERRAFILQKPEFTKLEDIINEIVKRCRGSPLAAKATGSMLSTKTSKDEWVVVLKKSSICNEETGILPILKLSYDNLPLHMKQCFAFCAVFPKDYEIDVENLIQLWMANDYVPREEDVPLETTGRRTFNELAWRSFFQDAKQTPLEDQNWIIFLVLRHARYMIL
ncbi:hypothetical protein C2845_PM13G04120 [Panicum miliaceum]|uniref:Disease resistance protein RGA3 n=1 Tax=Panicum miliaceum TaxID=4540 RepID=A0A3L6RGT7_PANMI|nr:hypothetical protein C2845_PM13G04120 [Panicum miliaceum]